MKKIISIACFMLAAGSTSVSAQGFTEQQKQELCPLIHEYLLANPEILIELSQILQQREDLEQQERAKAALSENADLLYRSAFSPVAGNHDGDVTLVEFFDYQCGYCKSVMVDVKNAVADDGNVRLVFKEFPILGPNSMYAAQAALAAKLQGDDKYEALHFALMGFSGELSERVVMGIARQSGLDVDTLRADMESEAVNDEIEANYQLASALGIEGTPGFVIGEQLFPGAISRNAIDQAIAEARSVQ